MLLEKKTHSQAARNFDETRTLLMHSFAFGAQKPGMKRSHVPDRMRISRTPRTARLRRVRLASWALNKKSLHVQKMH